MVEYSHYSSLAFCRTVKKKKYCNFQSVIVLAFSKRVSFPSGIMSGE